MDPERLGRTLQEVEATTSHVVNDGQAGPLGEGLAPDLGDPGGDGLAEPVDGSPVGGRDRNGEILPNGGRVGIHLGGFGPLFVGNCDCRGRQHGPL